MRTELVNCESPTSLCPHLSQSHNSHVKDTGIHKVRQMAKTVRTRKNGRMTRVMSDNANLTIFDDGVIIMSRKIGDDEASIHYRDGRAFWARVYVGDDGVGFEVNDPQTLGELVAW